MVEVDRPPQPLRRPRRPLAVGAVADHLVPGLEPVEAGGEEPRHRGRDQQVVEVALGLGDDPVPLLLVDHPPGALVEHPAGA